MKKPYIYYRSYTLERWQKLTYWRIEGARRRRRRLRFIERAATAEAFVSRAVDILILLYFGSLNIVQRILF